MASLTVSAKPHVKAMADLMQKRDEVVTVTVARPEGKTVITGILEDAKPFHAVWLSSGKEITGIDFIGRREAIISIISNGATLYDNSRNIPQELDYAPNREEVYGLRLESFGQDVAEALKEPQIGGNPATLGWKSPTAYLRKTGKEDRRTKASGSSSN